MQVNRTPSWSIYHVRAIGLPRLINDLDRHEATGIPEKTCADVKASLKAIIDATEAAPASFWSPCVTSDLHQFREVYAKWNDRLQGADLVDRIHRRDRIDELRALRSKMRRSLAASGTSKGPLLATDADKKVADAFYGELANLVKKHPVMFPGLAHGVAAYTRGPSTQVRKNRKLKFDMAH